VSDEANQGSGPGLGSLLAVSLAVGALDFFLLGLAITFGPSGFGGDRTMSAREVAAANLGQAAGFAGCLLAVAAVAVAVVMRSSPKGRPVMRTVVGLQLAATLLLALTTT
jgi:hypothetical protein